MFSGKFYLNDRKCRGRKTSDRDRRDPQQAPWDFWSIVDTPSDLLKSRIRMCQRKQRRIDCPDGLLRCKCQPQRLVRDNQEPTQAPEEPAKWRTDDGKIT